MSQRAEALAAVEEILRSPLPEVVSITGPRGIGRTTFLDALYGRLADDFHVITVPARPGREAFQSGRSMIAAMTSDPVLSSLRSVLEPLASGALSAGPDLDQQIESALEDADLDRPPLLIIDDVQVMDDESRAALLQFFDQARGHGWRAVCAEAGPLLPSAQKTAGSGASGSATAPIPAGRYVRPFLLDPLTIDDSRQALRHRTGVDAPRRLVAWLHRLSSGIPGLLLGFAAELSRETLQGAAPPPIVPVGSDPYLVEALAPTLRTLDARHRRALALFAHHEVVPREWRFADPELAEISELAAAGLVRLTDEGWAPSVPAVGVMAWQQLRYAERADLCRIAYAAWQQRDASEALYYGCQLVDSDPAGSKQVLAEVAGLVERGKYEQAYRLASTWWSAGNGGSDPEAVAVLAELCVQLGYPDVAAPLIDRRFSITDRETRIRLAATGLEAAMVRDRTWDGLLADLRPDRVGSIDTMETRLQTIRTAHALTVRGATVEARSILHGLPETELPETLRLLLELTRARIAVLSDEEPDGDRLRDLLVEWVERDAPGPWSFSATAVADLLALGDARTARRLADLALADPIRQSPISRNGHLITLISVDLCEGWYVHAARRAADLRAEISSDRPWITLHALDQVISAALGQDPETTSPPPSRVQPSTAAESSGYDADVGLALLIQGQPGQAAARLTAALRNGRLLRQGPSTVLADLIEAHVAAEDEKAARRCLARFRPRLLDSGSDRGRAALARLEALVAEPLNADAQFRAALELCTGDVPDLDLGRTMIAYGRFLRRIGQTQRSDAVLDEAEELLRSGSFAGWVEHIALLRDRSESGHWSQGLSRTQRQLVQLIITGRTYAELAEQLFVSRRTAARRVHELYRNLGLAGRSDLVALVHSDPPPWPEDENVP